MKMSLCTRHKVSPNGLKSKKMINHMLLLLQSPDLYQNKHLWEIWDWQVSTVYKSLLYFYVLLLFHTMSLYSSSSCPSTLFHHVFLFLHTTNLTHSSPRPSSLSLHVLLNFNTINLAYSSSCTSTLPLHLCLPFTSCPSPIPQYVFLLSPYTSTSCPSFLSHNVFQHFHTMFRCFSTSCHSVPLSSSGPHHVPLLFYVMSLLSMSMSF